MFRVLNFLRKNSFLLIVIWMGLYAFDLIDDLRHSYTNRASGELAWMLISDFIRCGLVMAIWAVSQFNPDEKHKD